MTNPIGIDNLGYDEQLYILAFDHRGSSRRWSAAGRRRSPARSS